MPTTARMWMFQLPATPLASSSSWMQRSGYAFVLRPRHRAAAASPKHAHVLTLASTQEE